MKYRFCIFLFLALLSPMLKAQWHVDTVITRAVCNEQGGRGGSIQLTVSGVPGPYTYYWSCGGSGDSVMNLAPGLYQVAISNGMGKDTAFLLNVLQWRCDPGPSTGFTPNGDGIHDTWPIDNIQYYPHLLVSVYNRWGQMVWEHTGWYEPWDGMSYLGIPVDGGTYYYVIYKDASDKGKGIVKGSVSIIR